MSIGFPTGDWCRSPSFSKTTPNMFKGRLNWGERFPEHNRGATYISATRSALFSGRFMWEDGCWSVGPKKKKKAALQTFPRLFDAPVMREVMVLHQQSIFSRNKDQLTDWIIHFHAALHSDRAWHRAFDQLVDRLSKKTDFDQ